MAEELKKEQDTRGFGERLAALSGCSRKSGFEGGARKNYRNWRLGYQTISQLQ